MHRTLARLFADRGVKMLRTSQLNVGGNMDFYNMLERERLESKKISKTNAVTSIMDHELPASDVYIGPSDYVPWLTDRKWAHIRVEGQAFGDVPLNVELKLEVWDSPNSAGIVIDAVRCCKLALNHGVGGQLDGPSSYLMKSPHNQRPDDQARRDTEKFIAQVRAQAGHAPEGPQSPGAREGAAPQPKAGRGARAARRSRSGRRRVRRRASRRSTGGRAGGIIVAPMRRDVLDRPRHALPVGGRGQRGQRARRARRRASSRGAGTACWCSRPRARRSACATRAGRCARRAASRRRLLEGTDGGEPRVIAVGEVLDVAARRAPAAGGAADRRRAHGRGTARRASSSTSCTCTSRSRRAPPTPRCATRAR